MTLTDSQRNFIKDRVSTVWKGKRECPICIIRTVWAISTLVEVREFNEGNHCPGAGITPLIQVECKNCGYTVLFNAIALDVVDRDTGKVKDPQ
jgi:hypothetical protein